MEENNNENNNLEEVQTNNIEVPNDNLNVTPTNDSSMNNENKITDDIEILELNEEEHKTKEPETEKHKNIFDIGKENKIIFLILIGILIFAFMLPTITSWFSKNSIFTYTDKMEEIKNNQTVDGMLEIGNEEGSITAKNIRFYNFTKKTNNQISVVYLPESGINNVNEKNIFIELYNKGKNVIYRTQFTTSAKLERKVQGIYTLNVNETIYKEAIYGKIVILKDDDFKNSNDTLVCTNITKENDYEIENKVTYNFSNMGLKSYVVSRRVINTVDSELNEEYSFFKKEEEIIEKTNVSDLTYDNDKVQYTIDLQTLDTKNSGYTLLYEKGSLKRQISLSEETKGWSCK